MSGDKLLNWRSGVIDPHMRFSTIWHSASALCVKPAQPRFKQISKTARRIRPADWVT